MFFTWKEFQDFMLAVFISPKLGIFTGVVKYIRPKLWKWLYGWMSKKSANDNHWQLINYGFMPDDGKLLDFEKEDLEERCGTTTFQLYYEVAKAAKIKNKNIVEIGCGRGGGASFIARYMGPKTVTAIDLSTDSIEFARKMTEKKKIPNLHFQQGDALSIPLPDNTYDVVINVESSHCYSDYRKFLSEVSRILKPGGYFLTCDMYIPKYIDLTEQAMSATGFIIRENVDITKNVVESMKLSSKTREDLLRDHVSEKSFFYNRARVFAGLDGSRQLERFIDGTLTYKRYALQKP